MVFKGVCRGIALHDIRKVSCYGSTSYQELHDLVSKAGATISSRRVELSVSVKKRERGLLRKFVTLLAIWAVAVERQE